MSWDSIAQNLKPETAGEKPAAPAPVVFSPYEEGDPDTDVSSDLSDLVDELCKQYDLLEDQRKHVGELRKKLESIMASFRRTKIETKDRGFITLNVTNSKVVTKGEIQKILGRKETAELWELLPTKTNSTLSIPKKEENRRKRRAILDLGSCNLAGYDNENERAYRSVAGVFGPS